MKRSSALWIVIGTIVVIAITAGVLVWGTYAHDWSWTGIGPQPALSGHVPVSIGQTSKTLWDVLQLLGIPVVLAGAAAWFNHAQQERELKRTEEQKERELQRTDDHQQEVTLGTYMDRMSDLLLREDAGGQDKIAVIARARTLTALRRLDGRRKGTLLHFLYEASVIHRIKVLDGKYGPGDAPERANTGQLTISLNGADLRGVDLRGVDPGAQKGWGAAPEERRSSSWAGGVDAVRYGSERRV